MTNRYDELPKEPPNGVTLLETPARVLTIGAHPDDAEFGAGATIARWAASGAHLTMCIVTDGSKGSWNPDLSTEELVTRRAEEQQAAADVLGASHVVALGHVDGDLEHSLALRDEIALQIRSHRPDVILTHDPWQRYQLHPDHRVTGLVAMDAVIAAREPMALRNSDSEAHRPTTVLLWSADQPDHAEPVEDAWFGVKVAALMCHTSQSRTTMGDAASGGEAHRRFVTSLTEWHRTMGGPFGLESAEAFKRLTP